jgi:biopolymer transport protein ExbD
MRKRRRRRSQSEVELNLAAMLDMAFQLLAFFILTFRPPPLEGQISLKLPPPQGTMVVKDGQQAGSDLKNKNPLEGVTSLTISVLADPRTGTITSLGIGENNQTQIPDIPTLDRELQRYLGDPGNPFNQVIIQVSDSCRYEELMKVIDICTHQKLPDGKKLSKLTFVGLPDG